MKRWNDYPEDAELVYEVQVDPRQIHYVCCTTEAYEGLAVVRTKDEKLGIVQFWVPVPLRSEFEEFLDHLGKEIALRVAAPRHHDDSDYDVNPNTPFHDD